jgi:hypothetical protein
MKKLLERMLYSENFRRVIIYMLFSYPMLTAAERLRLSRSLREMDSNRNEEMQSKIQMRKAS